MNIRTREFSKDGLIADFLKEVIQSVPKKSRVYVIGRAARNDVYFQLTKKTLPQRDVDLLLVGDLDTFVSNLRKHLFSFGRIRRKNDVVLKKKLIAKPTSLKDYLFLDIHRSEEPDVLTNLKNHAAFTINGFAIPLEAYLLKNNKKYTICLPRALADLTKHRLRLNPSGYQGHAGNIFACLRFMSLGFKAPPKKEVTLLLAQLPKLEAWRFERNVKKVFSYVGGERKARKLARSLGIKTDIFDMKTVRSMK